MVYKGKVEETIGDMQMLVGVVVLEIGYDGIVGFNLAGLCRNLCEARVGGCDGELYYVC